MLQNEESIENSGGHPNVHQRGAFGPYAELHTTLVLSGSQWDRWRAPDTLCLLQVDPTKPTFMTLGPFVLSKLTRLSQIRWLWIHFDVIV